jgi:hypothetical protein
MMISAELELPEEPDPVVVDPDPVVDPEPVEATGTDWQASLEYGESVEE